MFIFLLSEMMPTTRERGQAASVNVGTDLSLLLYFSLSPRPGLDPFQALKYFLSKTDRDREGGELSTGIKVFFFKPF